MSDQHRKISELKTLFASRLADVRNREASAAAMGDFYLSPIQSIKDWKFLLFLLDRWDTDLLRGVKDSASLVDLMWEEYCGQHAIRQGRTGEPI